MSGKDIRGKWLALGFVILIFLYLLSNIVLNTFSAGRNRFGLETCQQNMLFILDDISTKNFVLENASKGMRLFSVWTLGRYRVTNSKMENSEMAMKEIFAKFKHYGFKKGENIGHKEVFYNEKMKLKAEINFDKTYVLIYLCQDTLPEKLKL